MRLLLLSDFHVGARLEAWRDRSLERRNEILRTWDNAIDLALNDDRGADVILVAGDLFDQPDPEPDDRDPVLRGLERLSEAGKRVVLLPGVSDGVFTPANIYLQSRAFPSGVTAVTWETVRCLEVAVGEETLFLYCGALYPTVSEVSLLPEEGKTPDEGCHVALVHAALEASDGHAAWPVPLLERGAVEASELDLVVVGGVHIPFNETWKNTRVIAPGSPVGVHPEDVGERSLVMVEHRDQTLEVESIPVKVPPVATLRLDTQAQGLATREELVDHLSRHTRDVGMLTVTLVGDVERSWNEAAIEDAAQSLPALVRVENKTRLRVVGDDVEVSDTGTPRGAYMKEMRARIESAATERERRILEGALSVGLDDFGGSEVDHVD